LHGAGDYSDFFAELFGRMGGQHSPFHAGRAHARGEDHHAKVLLDIEDAYTSPNRQISLRVPQVDASGHVQLTTRTLNVKIPKGVHEGQVIRLAGQGAPGLGNAPPGDLMLEVHFRPHGRFTADGRDVHLTLPVAPWEAALGSVITVDLPQGQVKVRIPEGAQSGRQLRVRGKGLPDNPPGDLLLNLQVVLPPADSPRAKEIYETMQHELAFDPRREGRD
jgi:curved DNA-binding protein